MDYREGDGGTYTSGREICMNIRKLQCERGVQEKCCLKNGECT